MRVLLDTHAFLGRRSADPVEEGRTAIGDPGNECLLSLASCWEMAIKLSLSKLRLPSGIERFVPEQLAANAFRQLAIDFRHVARVATLPFHPVTRSTTCSLRRPSRNVVQSSLPIRCFGNTASSASGEAARVAGREIPELSVIEPLDH